MMCQINTIVNAELLWGESDKSDFCLETGMILPQVPFMRNYHKRIEENGKEEQSGVIKSVQRERLNETMCISSQPFKPLLFNI